VNEATVHLASAIVSLVGGAVSLYVSYRLMKNKEETLSEAKKMFPSKDSFDAHEKRDAERFEQMQAASERRHEELREDISKVEQRVDRLIVGRS
jgi:hypothetical protein